MFEEVWITGYGFVCAAGDDSDTCWGRIQERAELVKRHVICGNAYYPISNFDYGRWTSRRADQRQMGDLMHYATAAASSALASAGLDPAASVMPDLEIYVAASGGEPDVAADEATMRTWLASGEDRNVAMNRELLKTRPSHFLTQLPNLIPSNIAIVRGVAAPSRTFLGSEASSVEALRLAVDGVRHGDRSLFLVGSAKNGACLTTITSHAAAGWIRHDPCASVWAEDGKGFCIGSASAFVIVESRRHAEARSARPVGRVSSVVTSFAPRDGSARCESQLFERWKRGRQADPPDLVISGISGDGAVARRERGFLSRIAASHRPVVARAPARILGHSMEASFFMNLVLGLMCVERGEVFQPIDSAEPLERGPVSLQPVRDVLVTSWGTEGGEGFATVGAWS